MKVIIHIAVFILSSLIATAQANTTYHRVDLVKVDKSARVMYLMAGEDVVKQYHIALGASPKGHKVKEGDSKTPEGEYILDYKKEDSQFYRAMHISYPNAKDKARARMLGVDPGGFIMVHGQRNGDRRDAKRRQRFNWTDGCIALTNEQMDEFMALVETGTRIHIEW
ncbi:L,D-transpeptidase family protein [Thalassotalea ponticola]|uniref:L,D-transpeptidase family protein n=1 Tax=Thalassotalea ponticola TaxID=1523392 RepID=UPI0025B4AD12|nr:L,D-transpeptidase family protein [Thalassotalea ponticola]MDN3652236.1 L,D-transpeptidase family protein [Thalassotalea ponticola]